LKEGWRQYRHCLPAKPQAAVPTKHNHSSAASKREIVFGRPDLLVHLSITVRVTCYPDRGQWQYFNSSAYIYIWNDDVRDDLRKMGVNNWKQKAQERKPWRGIIEQAQNHKEL